jgi:L-alanine-DL-glutamate epimerase-like enolase superfamily enzyme
MKAYFQKRILHFRQPSATSRGILMQKPVWYIYLYDEQDSSYKGIGECSVIPGLSIDSLQFIETKLAEICQLINLGEFDFNKAVKDFPGVNFGLETALMDFNVRGSKILFPSLFTQGQGEIPTNGLIWMGTIEEITYQIEKKLEQGFRCIKLKIGSLDINDELLVLRNLRKRYTKSELEIRVDANGAFTFKNVSDVLKRLAEIEIHSIEQPILPSQLYEMAKICQDSPVPVALDEELLGIYPLENKKKLIELIKPQYLVLKPGLLGGFKEANDWIGIADELKTGWWVTSALESNIGLNAIAQWTYTLDVKMPQGLGTGQLYMNNVESPLEMRNEKIVYNTHRKWNYEFVY